MKEYESLSDLSLLIKYLEKTSPDEWLLDRVRSKDNSKNCFFGHLVNWYYGKDLDSQKNVSPIWDAFESMWATTYMIYPVNDGNAPKWMNFKYEQSTAKERVIAYLKNLNSKKEKSTEDLFREETPSK